MPANTSPIFTATPNTATLKITGNVGLAASDGVGTIGTNMWLLLTGAANGTFVSRIRIHFYATAAAQNTAATVLRFYLSSQASGNTTADNTTLIQEVGVGILAAAHATSALTPIDVPLNFVIPSGETLLVSTHANFAANTGVQITAIGGNY